MFSIFLYVITYFFADSSEISFFCSNHHFNLLFLQLEENFLYVLLCVHYFQMIARKVYQLLRNSDQLSSLSIGSEFLLLHLIDIFSNKLFVLILILIVVIILNYLELTKLPLVKKFCISYCKCCCSW